MKPAEKFQRELPLRRCEALGDAYARLTFHFPELAARACPGQFVSLSKPKHGFPILRRPFSIHRVLPDGDFQVLIKIIGPGSRQLTQSPSGEIISVLGPLGGGIFTADPTRPQVLLVAGGIGIAPLLFLADTLRSNKNLQLLLFFGGRQAADLPAREDFSALSIPARLATEDGSVGFRGLITEELSEQLNRMDPNRLQVMACGPMAMLKTVSRICARRQIPCQVSLETVMACGVGSCLGCVIEVHRDCGDAEVDYARVCHEGPVFDTRMLPWAEAS